MSEQQPPSAYPPDQPLPPVPTVVPPPPPGPYAPPGGYLPPAAPLPPGGYAPPGTAIPPAPYGTWAPGQPPAPMAGAPSMPRKKRRRVVRFTVLGVVLASILFGVISNALNPKVSTDKLAAGMCVKVPDLSGGKTKEVSNLPKVSCTKAHNAEVFAVVAHTATSYPGPGPDSVANDLCVGKFPTYVGPDDDGSGYALSLITPTAASWKAGKRNVVCILRYLDGNRTTSVKA
jgi:Septum formation